MRTLPVVATLSIVLGAACTIPEDQSMDLTVLLDSVPQLLLQDTARVTARLTDGTGNDIQGARIQLASSDQAVLTVDSTGLIRAIGAGMATLSATAIEYENAAAASGDLTVRSRLGVDSVTPTGAIRFGEQLTLHGIGLQPDSLFLVSVGGVAAQVHSYTPDDPDAPERTGQLEIWVPPPAPRTSAVSVLGFQGFTGSPNDITVLQRDRYEPNDTVPWALGSLPAGLRNPALAFEPVQRSGGADGGEFRVDWYRFTNTSTQDRTIAFFSEQGAAQTSGIFVTDSLEWFSPLETYFIGPFSWTIGPELYLCDGLGLTQGGEAVDVFEVEFPLSIMALRGLPAGTYHIFTPFQATGQAVPYELAIGNGYTSILAPDAAEENDYCNVAANLPANANLTIDNPHDPEWFRFSLGGLLPGTLSIDVSTSSPDGDLDLYLIRDFRPDSLVVVDIAEDYGPDDFLRTVIQPGAYLLLIIDYPGEVTNYTLTSSVTVPAPPAAAPFTLSQPITRQRTRGTLRSHLLPRAPRRSP